MSAGEIAAAVEGRLCGADRQPHVAGPVTVDSRQVTPGALFVAVPGENADGHDFAPAACAAGAGLVLAMREVPGVPCVVVEDTVTALGRLARHVLARLRQPMVIGVTGSSGKTSTKDLIGQVLARQGRTIAPRGSYNNEIGLPLTVLEADPSTRFLVLEMGARGVGHIAYLSSIAPPSIGVVLNVGLAHVGEFGTKEATARAKAELVEALPADGTAVLNADDPYVLRMRSATRARVLTYGDTGEIRSTGRRLDERGQPVFTLSTPGGTAPVRLNLHGEHHIGNALAAAGAAIATGMDVAAVADALSAATAVSPWRMEVVDRPDGVTIINDAYNANPDSTRAALEALAVIGKGRRTWAVLGEMLELGGRSATEHDAIGRYAVQLGVARLVAVGEGAVPIYGGAVRNGPRGGESMYVPDMEAAIVLLRDQIRPGDVVLVKASRGIGLERVAAALLPADDRAGGASSGERRNDRREVHA